MNVTYFKRFRMEVDLGLVPPVVPLPPGCAWVAWRNDLLDCHAEVKHRCFESELDARIFPSLGDRVGCLKLMLSISSQRGFLPGATWLIQQGEDYLGTVQGLVEARRVGMIQNLGVVPEARGLGLGTALLLKALHGFKAAGMRWGSLEVTADNTGALRLYRRLGFRKARTLFRSIESV